MLSLFYTCCRYQFVLQLRESLLNGRWVQSTVMKTRAWNSVWVSFVYKSFLNQCCETVWKSGCVTKLPLSLGNSKWHHFHLFLSGWNVLHQFMLCLAPSLHKVRYNRDLWKQTQILKNYPCQLFTILFTIFFNSFSWIWWLRLSKYLSELFRRF